jgi:hypothetical protein
VKQTGRPATILTVSVLAMPRVLPLGNVNSFFFKKLNHISKINTIIFKILKFIYIFLK